ncbi:MAG TPA: hypothetical protein VN256_21845 [Pyrinomonadaceae bacterium]|nr:hypothetical protein [Pyrinomonadaceae bacterium]
MAPANFSRDFPERLRAGTERRDTFYARAPGYHAVHYGRDEAESAGSVMTLKEEGIAVYRGDPDETSAAAAPLTPVYQLQPSGPLAVPTGKVYIRFAQGVEAASRREEVERAGYEIVKTSAYTPHTAWLQSNSGSIAQSLSNIHALESLADVENVEPQMLTAREAREA